MSKTPRFRTSSRAREESSLKTPPFVGPDPALRASGRGATEDGTTKGVGQEPTTVGASGQTPESPGNALRRAGAARPANRPTPVLRRDVARSCGLSARPGRPPPPPPGGADGFSPEGDARRAAGRCPLTKETCLQPGKSPKALPVGAYGAIGATRFAPCHGGTIQPTFRHFSQPPQHP